MDMTNSKEPEAVLHDWTIEHFKGDNLPFQYDMEDAERDYRIFRSQADYPSDLTPAQLQFEVATMIIEDCNGTPF